MDNSMDSSMDICLNSIPGNNKSDKYQRFHGFIDRYLFEFNT